MLNSQNINIENSLIRVKLLNKNNSKVIKLLKRSDFIAMKSEFRVKARGLTIQARKRTNDELLRGGNSVRVGFTCSRKVGGAVRRNYAKRRLKHLARECLPRLGRHGWDYNLIGYHKSTEEMNFDNLRKSFVNAIEQIHMFERAK